MKTNPLRSSRLGRLATAAFFLLLAATAGCARSPVEKAFAGGFEPDKNNKIITAYCTSCHSHKDFQAEPHLAQVSDLYKKKPYSEATECRICHWAKLKGWAIPWVKRTTRRPHGHMTP